LRGFTDDFAVLPVYRGSNSSDLAPVYSLGPCQRFTIISAAQSINCTCRLTSLEDIALNRRNFFVKIRETFVASVHRNETIIKAVSVTFLAVIIGSIALTVFAFSASPGLSTLFKSLQQNEKAYIGIPPPYTETLYFYIFLNNVGHFWNPISMLVWVPFLGTLTMGLELLLNGVIIGSLATLAGMTNGIAYPILGLVPHGVLEIPAFIFEFTSIIRWQVTTIEAIMAKLTGQKVNGVKLKQDVKDTLILAIASVILFAIAAVIETYVTPHLLGR
jgi:stage II sporulation protein M